MRGFDLDAIVYIGVRAVFGFSAAALLGALGMVLAWMVWSQSLGDTLNFVYFQTTLAGIGAGVGAFVGWLRLDTARTVLTLALLAVLAFGLAGAWGGLGYGRMVYGVPGLRDPSRLTIVMGAAVAANIPGLLWTTIWMMRGGRM